MLSVSTKTWSKATSKKNYHVEWKCIQQNFHAPSELSMLLESACNCISLDKARWITVTIRIPVFSSYTNILFEGERRSRNTLLLMASRANLPKHAVCSHCTALPAMKSLGHQNWPLFACSSLSTLRLLHICIRNDQQECNVTKLKNLWLPMSCSEFLYLHNAFPSLKSSWAHH